MKSAVDAVPAVQSTGLLKVWSFVRPTTILGRIAQGIVQAFVRRKNHVCAAPIVWGYSWSNVVSIFDQLVCSVWPTAEDEHRDASISQSLGLAIIRSISTNRGSAIVCGYLLGMGVFVLHSRTGGRRATQMPLTLVKVREGSCRECSLNVKQVGILVVLDAFIKPLVLGSALDVFLFTPLTSPTPSSWIGFWMSATYANAFYHWLLGNLMMMLLQHTLRDVERNLRPGALLKFEDYLDPRSPSIRSMIKNHILWHIMSFLVGLLSIVVLLWTSVGMVVDLNNHVTPNFLPVRWSPRYVDLSARTPKSHHRLDCPCQTCQWIS